jgi:aminopeptidase N
MTLRNLFQRGIVAALTGVLIGAVSVTGTAEEFGEILCLHGHRHAFRSMAAGEPGDPGYRKYAPDRRADYIQLTLDVTPDFELNRIDATATIQLVPVGFPLKKLTLDAVDLDIHAVSASKEIESWHNSGTHLDIVFVNPAPTGQTVEVEIAYSATPEDGLFFRTPANGYAAGDTQLWTQGEPLSHRHWFPSHDFPNEKMKTEMICHVPADMIALSNGRLVDERLSADGSMKTFHWLQDKPHVNYLVSLVAGYFAHKEDTYRDIPLAFYVPPSEADQIDNSFQDTRSIMEFFIDEIGVDYPWDKYFNVCAIDYMFGGMENTSITTLTERTLFTDDFENLRSSRGLDAHELAHQWFGDLVTCKDWSQLWLNEGFATYYSLLYDRHKMGEDFFRLGLWRNARNILGNSNDETPIVDKSYGKPMDQFSFRAYPKGAWVLHMLRTRLGEDNYRTAVKNYLDEYRYQSVVTENLQKHFEKQSGLNLDRFFDQWVHLAGAPELKASYEWDAELKVARVRIEQVQKTSEKRPFFHFPLKVRFYSEDSHVDHIVEIDETVETFAFGLEAEPHSVRLDPDVEVLAKIELSLPDRLLENQARNQRDSIGRLMAIQKLGQKDAHDIRQLLADTLASDPFFAVREEAASLLGRHKNEENLEILISHLDDDDARVRENVVRAVSGFFTDDAYAALKRVCDRETNPQILAIAIRALPKFGNASTRKVLVTALQSGSYRQTVERAALDAARTLDNSSMAPVIHQFIRDHGDLIDSAALGDALETLGFLVRNARENQLTSTRLFLQDYLNHRKDGVVRAAMRGLGSLGDEQAIPVLQAYSGSNADDPTAQAARSAIDNIRKANPEQPQLDQLRKQVQSYESEVESLRKELESLENRWKELEKSLKASAGAAD